MKIPYFSWLFLIPICSLFVSFGIFVVSGQCLGDQRSYLLDLKNSLPNNTWSTKLVRWNESADCCFWEGVTCSREGRVIGLNLFNESITAGLDSSSSLFSLQYLENLNLAYNCFNSPIPKEFRKLKNLSYLNLSNACFAGQIPNAISSLTRLVTLDLSTNYFLADSTLKLEDPNLAMLVQNLSELKELYLDGVTISVQGYEWCQALSSSLPNLRVLSMSGCSLSGPFEFSLSKLQFLSIISLHNNPFYAPVPEFFANFTNLTSLELSFCGLNGTFPKKIFQIQTLQKLDLSGNDLLQGSLPEFLSNGSLRSLLLGSTNFSGTLPNSISNLTMLSRIDLSLCNFSGSIPSSMANLTQLVYLDMSSNNFTGPIPSFSMAKNLTQIYLSFNHLTGKIHFLNWEGLLNLVNLELSHNSLEGYIPVSLFSLPSLQILRLSNNHFSGQLNEFSNVSSCQLKTLDLSSNYLEGPIPMSIFELQDLASNKFTGQLQIKSFSTKAMLDDEDKDQPMLNHIQFEVQFSQYYYQDAITVTCKGQDLELVKILTIFTSIDVSCNNLEGPIPEKIGELKSLYVLNLSHNSFTDSIPPSLGKLSNLESLDLSSNRLTGAIPMQLADGLTFLSVLNLSFNQLVGQIPQIKQFATFLETSYEGNKGLYGFPLECKHDEPGALPPTFEETHSKSWIWTDWKNYISAELGFIFGFWVVVGPLVYWKRNSVEEHKRVRCRAEDKVDSSSYQRPTIKGSVATWLKGHWHMTFVTGPLHKLPSMLSILDLHSNQLQGQLPTLPPSPTYLDFSRNNFSSVIHDSIGSNLTLAAFLSLSNNQLSGSIPESLCDAIDLQVLDLSDNLLSGTIPQCSYEMSETLMVLDVRRNRLSGNISDSFSVNCSLQTLNLNGNLFKGVVPESLGNCKKLEVLDLGNNKIKYAFPCYLKNLSSLHVLILRSNKFYGPNTLADA
nr:receptor-like protein 12 [Quercus suber]